MALRLTGKAPKAGAPDRRTYQIDVQDGRRRIRVSSGTRNKALALRRQQDVLDALRDNPEVTLGELQVRIRGQYRGQAASLTRHCPGSMTLRQACNVALDDPMPWGKSRQGWAKARSRDTYVAICNTLCRILGGSLPVHTVTQDTLDQLVFQLVDDDAAPGTVNRRVFVFLSVLRRLIERKQLNIELPRWRPLDEAEAVRSFVLSLEQERELFGALRDLDDRPDNPQGGNPVRRDASDYLDLFTFLADVGCRVSAALNVRWDDVVQDREGHWHVRFWRKNEQKGGRTRTTPCTARVAHILRRRASNGLTGPFTGLTRGRAIYLWQKAKANTTMAGIPDCVVHSLRHTCATRMLEATGDIKLVQDWLGHSAIQTTSATYAKVMTGQKLAGLERLEGYLKAPSVGIR
ncbi:MAG: site-specific integrase [Pseudomonadota bacterium]|nr:site-specific integrase [Pseudomonadota bacterium]